MQLNLTANNKRVKILNLDQPVVMGILNVTPDSFSDGGQYHALDAAFQQAQKMVADGATIIDIGGESTRPGASAVSLEEELARVIPIIERISAQLDVIISIDTSKAQVMRQAIAAGAHIINDVRALKEEGALQAAAELAVPVCIMHMQGQPSNMQDAPAYQDVTAEVVSFLELRILDCVNAGIKRENIILDPGFGFGKTLEQNYQLLADTAVFHQFGLPVLIGVSRKSMIGNLLQCDESQRLAGSLACANSAATDGAHIFRVHDVRETADTLAIVSQLKKHRVC
ncbi:dihydropteroate synthase [Moritella sp. F3]|uniref:dihydropteroate synthase n=1 Tax=Moritella sp. F3 TaxID=2718882 RepID=UPI0018E0E053|nr:dihydropteroate synthase [Moritella sp. F3]GIC75896.1 dihydropteroate synthase [Moritella sp. F1]GIC81435.1 dihydropteroate synthase [Moritella sp. F3]